jgi:hypothetical protein
MTQGTKVRRGLRKCSVDKFVESLAIRRRDHVHAHGPLAPLAAHDVAEEAAEESLELDDLRRRDLPRAIEGRRCAVSVKGTAGRGGVGRGGAGWGGARVATRRASAKDTPPIHTHTQSKRRTRAEERGAHVVLFDIRGALVADARKSQEDHDQDCAHDNPNDDSHARRARRSAGRRSTRRAHAGHAHARRGRHAVARIAHQTRGVVACAVEAVGIQARWVSGSERCKSRALK